MKRKDEVRPASTYERAMTAGLTLHCSAESMERRQHHLGLRRSIRIECDGPPTATKTLCVRQPRRPARRSSRDSSFAGLQRHESGHPAAPSRRASSKAVARLSDRALATLRKEAACRCRGNVLPHPTILRHSRPKARERHCTDRLRRRIRPWHRSADQEWKSEVGTEPSSRTAAFVAPTGRADDRAARAPNGRRFLRQLCSRGLTASPESAIT